MKVIIDKIVATRFSFVIQMYGMKTAIVANWKIVAIRANIKEPNSMHQKKPNLPKMKMIEYGAAHIKNIIKNATNAEYGTDAKIWAM